MARRKKYSDRPSDTKSHPIATLSFPQGALRLAITESGLRWTTDSADEDLKSKTSWANFRSTPPSYTYSPADGPNGYTIASIVAQELGGALQFASVPVVEEEVVGLTGPADPAVENMAVNSDSDDFDWDLIDEQADLELEAARNAEDAAIEAERDEQDAALESERDRLDAIAEELEDARSIDPLTLNERMDAYQVEQFSLGESEARMHEARMQEDIERAERRLVEDQAIMESRRQREEREEREK